MTAYRIAVVAFIILAAWGTTYLRFGAGLHLTQREIFVAFWPWIVGLWFIGFMLLLINPKNRGNKNERKKELHKQPSNHY